VTPVLSSACEALLDRKGDFLDIAITNCSPEKLLRIPPQRIDLHDARVAHHSDSPIRCNREQILERIRTDAQPRNKERGLPTHRKMKRSVAQLEAEYGDKAAQPEQE
jgi:hypothetical protein